MEDFFNESTLSAYFPGLVDICINDDGQLVYAVVKEGELVFIQEYSTETESLTIPERKHFPFTLPRAEGVKKYYDQEDHYLYDDLIAYLKRFSALDNEQWSIVGHYIFLTYLHDNPGIDYCPYILFNAVPERGKSRTGKSIIYVAFRGIHLVELRETNIFRYSQHLHGTLFFDLLDISNKAKRSNCEDLLLLRYEKGAKCSRVLHPDLGPFNDTEYFDIYGPTIIASNTSLDKILETRCLPVNMPNCPGNYENPRLELGITLKERLTAWRARHLNTKLPNIAPIDGISGRLWDLAKPLFLINSLLPVDDQVLQDAILTIAGEKNESRKETIDGRLVAIIKEITDENGLDQFIEWTIKTNDIRSRFNEGRPEEWQKSAQWIGKRLQHMSFRHRKVNGHSEIILTLEEYKTILKQYGFAAKTISSTDSPDNSLPENNEQGQSSRKEVESDRESAQTEDSFDFKSPTEREIYEEYLKALKDQGKMTEKEMEQLAYKQLKESRRYEASLTETEFLEK